LKFEKLKGGQTFSKAHIRPLKLKRENKLSSSGSIQKNITDFMGLYKNGCIVLLFCLSFFSGACKKSTSYDTTTLPTRPPSTTPLTYQLVWSDEFDSTAINTANWNFETGGNGWGNNEQEYYQSDNATVANGNLIITAKKETQGSNPYTSARMTTAGKRTFTYGKMEARMKIPVGQGLWPAFWALGSNITSVSWPACGEIDIMEHINADSLIYGTLHWNNNGHVSSGGKMNSTPTDYHVYAVEWDESSIRWYVDNVKYHEVAFSNGDNTVSIFSKPFYLLFNLAVGGNWPGQTVDESKLPARLYVDYVRVYQRK